jgi:hypothetical protein
MIGGAWDIKLEMMQQYQCLIWCPMIGKKIGKSC